jgi:PAS domain S-box-containing protein
MDPGLQHRKKRPLLRTQQIEGREWWLWVFAVTVTLALTAGIVLLTFAHQEGNAAYWYDLREWSRGLAALVLIFDIYTVYQHLQLSRIRREFAEQNELFQLITENAADMIAVVDRTGRRIYNSPAYEKVLGYSSDELLTSASINQVHPADREKVLQAAEKAQTSGRGQRLEYRMRHKDGSWRFLESTASPVENRKGEIEKLVIVNRDISDRRRAEDMLAHNAFHDALTDLPNRALFVDRLQHALVRARRHSDYKFAVLFIDLDELKVVNDSLGHSAGDELLLQIGKRLSACFRETDTIARTNSDAGEAPVNEDGVARCGGDEFTVLLEDVYNASDAIRVAQRIQGRLANPFTVNGQQIVIAASVGIVLSSSSYNRAEDLLRDAEIAMYRAKAGGKARCEVFDPGMHSTAVRRLQLETDLRRALEVGELIVYYQPIVSLETRRITGFEALSRWRTSAGLVSPAEFIPLADETGLILAINHKLFLEACQQLRTWQAQVGSDVPLSMSLNISRRQFASPELVEEVQSILQQTSVQPASVYLEIVETITMGDAGRTMAVLSQLRDLGVKLSLDDFGTGYSSLSRLPRFPLDTLKIDRVFVSDMVTNQENREIVRLMVLLGHTFGLKVVAEGVEHLDQIKQLQQLGCDLAQGYFFSPPVAVQDASGLLLRRSPMFV